MLLAVVTGMVTAAPGMARQIRTDASLTQSDGPLRFARWMVSDARAIGTSIARPDPRVVAGTAAILVPATFVDPFVNDGVRRASGRHVESWLDRTNGLTGSRARLPMLGIFGASVVSGHHGLQDAAFTSLQSWLYAGVFHRAVKGLVGRARPNVSPGGRHYEPFSEHRSFPSGHTTDAFAIVTPWILYADTPVAYALFAVPAGTAVARLEKGKHFMTDVLAGAAIGIGTSLFLVRRHRAERSASVAENEGPGRTDDGLSAPPDTISGDETRIRTDLRIHPRGVRLTMTF